MLLIYLSSIWRGTAYSTGVNTIELKKNLGLQSPVSQTYFFRSNSTSMKILIYRNAVSGDDIDIVTLFCTRNKGKSVVSCAISHSHNFHKLEDRKIWFPSKSNCDGKPPGCFSSFHFHLSNSVSVLTSYPIVVILTLSKQPISLQGQTFRIWN